MIVQSLTSVMVYIAAVASLVFVVRYLRTGWHKTAMGRHMMAFMTMVFILLSLAVVNRLFTLPDVLWNTLRFTGFFLLDCVVIRQVYLLYKYQRDGQDEDKDVS